MRDLVRTVLAMILVLCVLGTPTGASASAGSGIERAVKDLFAARANVVMGHSQEAVGLF